MMTGADLQQLQLQQQAPPVDQELSATVEITNKLGLHARPAMSFVETASTFQSDVWVKGNNQRVDGKSIMQMMMLAAARGTRLEILAKGPDARDAISTLVELVKRGFDEE